jgi:aminoglycoside phosphotransferase (APT) family kinase protein
MTPDAQLQSFVVRAGLARTSDPVRWTALTGGVSSDIWRVDLPDRSVCIKRALAQLKVAAVWHAPTSRNAFEWEWLKFAGAHVPQAVPKTLAHDEEAGLFAMEFLDPAQHPVWKQQLMQGQVDAEVAASVGALVATVHAASAGDAAVAARFATDDNFYALRLEPYLVATAARHPALSARILAIAERTAQTHLALVHGDVSPKNILVGPRSPILLDAECAWYGDPAFDVAFCLNHLLLKCLVHPWRRAAYLGAFTAFTTHYLARVTWEPIASLQERAAALLPALLLARLDGKSPVEYLQSDAVKQQAREAIRPLVADCPQTLAAVAQHWDTALGA